jgi:hypothetical protein
MTKICFDCYFIGLMDILYYSEGILPSESYGTTIYYFSALTETLPILLNFNCGCTILKAMITSLYTYSSYYYICIS